MQFGLGIICSPIFFLQQICLLILVNVRSLCFAICGFKGGSKMQNKVKQARLFPYFKHLIVHLLIIFCTDIEQLINFFLLFFYLDCIHVKCIYNKGGGSLEVQNPKEYLRYKYKYILNNNLYHALSMSESTVDRHVYIFLNRMVYTTYNLTNLEAIKIEYTIISLRGTLISKILKF